MRRLVAEKVLVDIVLVEVPIGNWATGQLQ